MILVSVLALLSHGHALPFDQRRILSEPSEDNATMNAENHAALFDTLVLKYNKNYADEKTRAHRFGVFKENMKLAGDLNDASSNGVKHGANNKFFDMSHEEFKSKVLMTKKSGSRPRQGSLTLNSTTVSSGIPSSWDWRDRGAVTSVKDQGMAGTCWAFGAIGNIEGQLAIHQNNLVDLSVEQVADCAAGNACGVWGGEASDAFEYIINTGGIQTWDDYPYCLLDGQCSPCLAPGYDVDSCGVQPRHCKLEESCHFDSSKAVATLTSWVSLSQNENELAAQLVQNGPISVGLDADHLHTYSEGIVGTNYCSADPEDGNHEVLIVGYGSTASEEGGPEIPYWIAKNSWGADWGEDGYFRILRGNNACGIANQAVTAIL